MIIAIHFIADPLFYHFSALVVKDSLVACFLKPCALVTVKLLPLNDSVSLANSADNFVLVGLLYWSAVDSLLCRAYECLLNEVSVAQRPSTRFYFMNNFTLRSFSS